jgi:predicted signal transduction protein with EAL and GGDEF domain
MEGHQGLEQPGVETEAAFEAVRRHGCDIAQGYWICRPSTATEITEWLATAARPGLRSGATGVLEV